VKESRTRKRQIQPRIYEGNFWSTSSVHIFKTKTKQEKGEEEEKEGIRKGKREKEWKY
jgi:hypothetical protein